MWKCGTCIHKDNLEDTKGICIRLCKDVFLRMDKINQCYQEIIDKPLNCGICKYLLNQNGCMCTVNNFNYDDKYIFYKPIRKNYLSKNTPIWCQLK